MRLVPICEKGIIYWELATIDLKSQQSNFEYRNPKHPRTMSAHIRKNPMLKTGGN